MAPKPGRPRLSPPVRLVLHLRPEDKLELLALADGRQIAAFLLDCARVAARTRPGSRTEKPLTTRYDYRRLIDSTAVCAQLLVQIYKQGRIHTVYTGIEYPDEATAQRACAALNQEPPHGE